jgi:L-fucose dehydrogenase
MDLGLKSKVIIVSGGAKGIGAGITTSLSAEGAIPVIIGRNEADNESMLKEIGGNGFAITAELIHPETCKNAIDEVIKKFGKIDGLVNNAGVNDGVGLENGDYESFMLSLHKNLVHYYMLAHVAYRN